MPKFQYTAMDSSGKESKGQMDAATEQEVQNKLRDDGLYPTNISMVKGSSDSKKKKGKKKGGSGGAMNINLGPKKIPIKKVTVFTRQMATLLDAGLPLVRALRTLEKQAKRDPITQEILGEIATDVEGGATYSEALANQKKSFNDLYINMIRAGEASGAMEVVLHRLSEFMEKAEKLRRKVKAALMYPVAVLSIALLITWGLMVFIVPKFAKIFNDMLDGEPLPGLTQFVMDVSQFLQDQIAVCVGGVGALIGGFKVFKGTKQGGFILDTLSLKLPPFGGLVTKVVIARFCRTLSTLLNSGVAILGALDITRDTCGNQVVSRAVQKVHDAVKEGEPMARTVEETKVFPGMVVSMIEVGEETGALPDMLGRIADVYDDEVDTAVEGLTSLIEPIMIVFLAVIVGGIVLALFLPLISLLDKLGG